MFHNISHRKMFSFSKTGLNAGVMHMHMDRMRNIPDGWIETTLAMYDKYKSRIRMVDQDIMNIFFSLYPEKLYKLPCEWNYRPSLFRQVRINAVGK